MASQKVWARQAHIEAINHRLAPATVGFSYPGHIFDGLVNGIATGFQGDCILPEVSAATQVPQRLVAAAAGADLATPVAYWFQKQPIRLRVGSTTAAAIPATSGLRNTITERPTARGVLRMGLADVNAAAQFILDQGGMLPIPCGSSTPWEVAYHISNVTNKHLATALGKADIGVIGGVAGVDPTAVINAAGVIFRLGANKLSLISIATTETVIASRNFPSADFVLAFQFNPATRQVSAFIDNDYVGAYVLPAAVTAVELGARVIHQAGYTAATALHDPLGVDIDGILVNVPVQIV
jgi:hypothetical protein